MYNNNYFHYKWTRLYYFIYIFYIILLWMHTLHTGYIMYSQTCI